MVNILQKEDPKLRKQAEEVKLEDIGSKRIKDILARMQEALESQDDGVAIAAPQIGESLRIFIMSRRVPELIAESKDKNRLKDGKMEEGKIKEKNKKEKFQDQIFINPKITKLSKEKEMMEEGCLSVRYLYGKVMRSKKATVQAIDENGKKFTMGGSGLVAQIFQHETDHLDGVLFTDEATDLEEIPPEKVVSSKN